MTSANSDVEPPDRTGNGRFEEQYSDTAFLVAIRNEGGIAGTSDVCQQVGCAYETAFKRLHTLADRGEIHRRVIGRTNLWVNDD